MTLDTLHSCSELRFLSEKGRLISVFVVMPRGKRAPQEGVQERACSLWLPLVPGTPQATISQGLGHVWDRRKESECAMRKAGVAVTREGAFDGVSCGRRARAPPGASETGLWPGGPKGVGKRLFFVHRTPMAPCGGATRERSSRKGDTTKRNLPTLPGGCLGHLEPQGELAAQPSPGRSCESRPRGQSGRRGLFPPGVTAAPFRSRPI